MKNISIIILAIIISGCSSSVAKRDILDVSPKGKSLKEIVIPLENKGYRCSKRDASSYEVDSFSKSGHKILKHTCVKQTDSAFCVDSHFINIFQNIATEKIIYISAQSSPTCIWH